jgi:hypothetical protein
MSLECAPHVRKSLERLKHARDSPAGVVGEAVREDEAVQILSGDGADRDLCHRGLELVEVDDLSGFAALQPESRPLVGTGNAVEQGCDIARLGVGVFDCHREQRTRERSLLDVGTRSELCEPRCVLGIERDVQAI